MPKKKINTKTKKSISKKTKKEKVVKVKKSVKTKKTKRVEKKKIVEDKRIHIGGLPLANGIFLRGEKNLVVTMKDRAGRVEIIPFKIQDIRSKYPFLFLPFLRGITSVIENIYFYLKVLWVKRVFVKRGLRSKTRYERFLLRFNQYINHTILLFIVISFFNYLFIRINDISLATGGNSFYNFGVSLFFILIIFSITALFFFDKKTESELFSYHGAEHMVLENYEDGLPPKWENLKRQNIQSDKCSVVTTIWAMILLALLITVFKVNQADFFWGILVSIGFILASFSIAYELIMIVLGTRSKILKGIFINPLSWLQLLFIQVPDKKHIEVVKIALNELVKLEKE